MKMLRWLGWLVGALIIGALGNGVWELALRDYYSWISRGILTRATLGLDSTRNSIYANVAQGHHELPSLVVFMFVVLGQVAVPLLFMVRFWIQEHPPTAESREESERKLSRLSRFLYLSGTVWFFFGVASFAQGIMLTYTNSAITHFQHSLSICAPYLTNEEERVIRSQFALLKTSTDYKAVIHKLQDAAAQHQIALREFTIW